MEENELDAKRAQAEKYLSTGKFDDARTIAEEMIAFAKRTKNRDLKEEMEYFNINLEEQERKLAMKTKKVEAVVASPEQPVEGVEVTEGSAAESVPAQAGEGVIPWGKNIIREKYRFTINGGELLLKKAFLNRAAADEYCQQLQTNGKKSMVDFKLITVIRKKLANQHCFNDKGESFVVYEC